MIRLHINIDHVATLRNQRDTAYPDPALAAQLCLDAGVDGITVHLREDRRHIRDADVDRVRLVVAGGKCLNLELAAAAEMAQVVRRVRPDAVTLVPEKRQERTTEGGLDVPKARSEIALVREACEEVGARLCLFVEPIVAQVQASRELGAAQVEFHTGHYCDAPTGERPRLLEDFVRAIEVAHSLGLEVAAGHGLTTGNVGPIARLPHMAELNIGHSVISEAVYVGLPAAVRSLRAAIDAAIDVA